jgi:hypothetical protein
MRKALLRRLLIRLTAVLLMFPSAARLACAQSGNPTFAAKTDYFEFYSDPWINLHHLLYQWSREELGPVADRQPIPERADMEKLSGPDREIWLEAVAFYRASVAPRWHLDLEMLRLNRELLLLHGDPSADPPDRIKGIAATLRSTMPIYRKLWWAEHDRTNRLWIARLTPLLRRHEARYVQLTTRVYGTAWPDSAIRVDVSAYFNSRAGYTAREGRIVMYSKDPDSQDLYALEMLLHEVQHVEPISDPAIGFSGLAAAFKAAGAKQPENLAHVLIFATAGEFARSVAAAEGLPEHTPYWIKQGLDKQDVWSSLWPIVQKHWLPIVRAEISRDEGLAAVARAVAQSTPK